jgi:Putative adhesin
MAPTSLPSPPLTRGRRVILLVGLPIVLALIGFAVSGWIQGILTSLASHALVGYPVALSAPPVNGQARLSTGQGDVRLQAGAVHRIQVRGRLAASFTGPTFSHQLTPAGLMLRPHCRVPVGTCSLKFAVTVPAGLPVAVDSSFGDLTASGLHGRVALSANSGDLHASQLAGDIRLSNAFGDITASDLAGAIRLVNNSGDIIASALTGNSRLQDSFGDIDVTGLAAADVVASNNSGDITIQFTQVPRQVNVTDSFGDITLVLPPGATTYRVSARTSFGTTTVSVPQAATATSVITASNNSGDIRIVRAKAPAPPAQPPQPRGPASPR